MDDPIYDEFMDGPMDDIQMGGTIGDHQDGEHTESNDGHQNPIDTFYMVWSKAIDAMHLPAV